MNAQRSSLPALILFSSLAGGFAYSAELQFDPAYARNPPDVAEATVQLLPKPTPAANAVLRVRFVDQRRNTAIVIDGGRVRTMLRDDGAAPDARAADGHYAAFVQVNSERYSTEQRRRIELAKRYPQLPEFRNRQLVGAVAFRPSQATTLRTDVATVIDKFKGVPFVVDPWRELMITNVGVVEDPERTYDVCTGAGTPMGAWTFGRLMTEMANEPVTGIPAGDFVEEWLEQWTQDLTINGWTVHERPTAQAFIDAWPRLPDGRLDLAQAPFRLLAIVNRIDLRENTVYGGSSAGEARLVFGFLDCNDELPGTPGLEESTVIFEYGIDRNGCFGVRNWAQQWKALGAMTPGSAAYNDALQAITDQFTLANARPTQAPNRSAINQVRTNETIFHNSQDPFWELRESRLPKFCALGAPCEGWLRHATIAQTPDQSKNFSIVLRNFINFNAADILAGAHTVPTSTGGGGSFRGGHLPQGSGWPWNASGILDADARHAFSLATCNSCHRAETSTLFVHIENRHPGTASVLSDFLTGEDMPKSDPITDEDRTFHDLLDRQAKLDAAVSMTCGLTGEIAVEDLFEPHLPSAFVH
jgi:hypothetical protein